MVPGYIELNKNWEYDKQPTAPKENKQVYDLLSACCKK